MKATFYGVRGSIPTPGETTVRYGGNTTCIHIEADGAEYLFDTGSGSREAGNALMKKYCGKVNTTIFLTHPHFDHIQGFPFFTPAYVPGCTVDIQRSTDKTIDDKVATATNKSPATNNLKEIFRKQQDPAYFPISLEQMAANIHFSEFNGELHKQGTKITPLHHTAHPGGMVAYRMDKDGKSIAFTGDYEHDGICAGDFGRVDKKIIEWAKHADVLIIDAQYTPEEYLKKKGWGHSTIERVCEIAAAANAKKLVITHHDPSHDDKTLDEMQERSQRYMREVVKQNIPVLYAREGMTLDV